MLIFLTSTGMLGLYIFEWSCRVQNTQEVWVNSVPFEYVLSTVSSVFSLNQECSQEGSALVKCVQLECQGGSIWIKWLWQDSWDRMAVNQTSRTGESMQIDRLSSSMSFFFKSPHCDHNSEFRLCTSGINLLIDTKAVVREWSRKKRKKPKAVQ